MVGIPDAVLGQRMVGFVKLADGAKDTVVSEILGNVATRLASYKVPESLEIIDELPRNALSKVDRNALQAIAAKTDQADKAGPALIEAMALQPKQPDARLPSRVARIS